MKRVFSRITAAILSSLALTACSPGSDSGHDSEGVRVLAPMINTKGAYSLEILNLKGITDLQTMTGQFARFFMSPRIVENHLDGTAPKTRFLRNKNNEYVPANEITQQLVTIYAHMQRFAQLDEELGAAGVNKWPRDVGVAVRATGGSKNNAYYDGQTDSMLFVPYVKENLPIPVNGGILAHEHFHSLFYKLALPDFVHEDLLAELRGRPKISIDVGDVDTGERQIDYYYKLTITRALNEGLADFWGWMYSGDPDFIAQSLPNEKSKRSLEVTDESVEKSISSKKLIQRKLETLYSRCTSSQFKDCVVGYAYTLAPEYSRFLKRFSDMFAKERNLDSLAARKEVAKIIVKVLPHIKKKFAQSTSEFYTPENFLETFLSQVDDLKENECNFLAKVLKAASDDDSTAYVCKEEAGWKIEKSALNKTEEQGR